MNRKKNLRRLSVLVTAQTLYNLQKLADMAGNRNVGRAVDKLTREKMLALKGVVPDVAGANVGGADDNVPINEPLTLEQLREMNGEPAWWDDGEGSCWGIISVDSAGMWGGIPFFRGRWRQVNFEYNIEERKMKIYRRPPEGEEDT